MAEKIKKKYLITIVDDVTGGTLWNQRFTPLTLGISLTMMAVTIAALFWCAVAFTPIRTLIPGYPDARTRSEAVYNAIRIDSIERMMTRWEFYAQNLRRVVEGDQPLPLDNVFVEQDDSELDVDLESLSGSDSLLRKIVSEAEQFEISGGERSLPIEGLHFYAPIKGVISAPYDPTFHPYIDVSAPTGSVVLSILDGTVVFAGLTDDGDYMIQIQHSGDLLSIYRHNQRLLKSVGDKISAGTAIALVGAAGASGNDHLHFELWYRGNAVNPASYISF